ncbi:MAG: HEAT repeat domain-containing protein [Candidatus Ozemobacteraceae bacterium]
MKTLEEGDIPLTISILREKGLSDFPEEVLPFILGMFKQYGSREDLPAIEELCRHSNPRVLAAAIEALEKINPDDLKAFIVPLLINSSTGIQSKAIRILYRWDQQEALRHFEVMLFSEEPQERQTALSQAYFFPFPSIEPFLMKFLGMESDVELIKKAGFLFQVNPQPEEPLRLTEVWETSSGEKRQLIGQILTGVVEALSKAGLVDKPPKEILEELREQYRKRKIIYLVDQCRIALESDNPEHRWGAFHRVEKLFRSGISESLSLLADHFSKESDPELKEKIRQFLGITKNKEAGQKEEPERLSLLERIQWLNTLSLASFKQYRKTLLKIMETGSEEEILPIIHAFETFGETSDAPFLKSFLKDAPPNVLAATVEAFRALDFETLIPYLPKLVQHPDEKIRELAVQAYVFYDKKQALTFVEQMLGAPKPLRREAGIFALGYFDFLSVKDQILAVFEKETDLDNLRQIGSIIKGNISLDFFIQLLGLAEKFSEPKASFGKKVIEEFAEILFRKEPKKFTHPKEFIEFAKSRITGESEKKKATPPLYAVQNIKRIRHEQTLSAKPKGMLDRFIPLPSFSLVPIALTGILLLFLFYQFSFSSEKPFSTPSEPSVRSSGGKTVSGRESPLVLGETREIQGGVNTAYADGISVILDSNNEQVFIRYDIPPRPFKRGDSFRGKIKVTKKDNGRTEGKLLKMY